MNPDPKSMIETLSAPGVDRPHDPTGEGGHSDSVLDIQDLRVSFSTEEGRLRAVDGVSLSMRRGRITALVGESGCGKSVTSYSILRLIQKPGEIDGGSITFRPSQGAPVDIASLSEKDKRLFDLRGNDIAMIYQEPMTALSPVHKIGNQMSEVILRHRKVSKAAARQRCIEMLGKVGIPNPARRMDQYPFELSGGMRQRVVIAMALLCDPQVLIADEPTTALDVTIQAQIMNLIKRLQRDLGMSVLLITHDLGVVAQVADDIAVMYMGRIVECGPARTILKRPRHPYTRGLLQSLPSLAFHRARLPSIAGSVPSLLEIPAGCPFHPRCPHAVPGICTTGGPPDLMPADAECETACLRVKEIDASPVAESDSQPGETGETATPAPKVSPGGQPLLSVRGLSKHYPIHSKGFWRKRIGSVKAADDINFDIMPGETLGLVGESGCGKTTTGRAILRAIDPSNGQVLFNLNPNHDTPVVDLATLSAKQLKPLRTEFQMVFQDPFASLNPRMTVGDIVSEPLDIHGIGTRHEREEAVKKMLVKVGLKPEHRTRYPHAFSGGQRQRIGIARALIMNPRLVVCDEAVSALDVSVQAQVINLLQDLQNELGLTYIFIAHDLSVVKHICDRIAVMYAGKIVELAPTEELFAHPRHPYTRALLSAIPSPDPDQPMETQLEGDVADPANLPPGCAFAPRCPHCSDICFQEPPRLRKASAQHVVACVLQEDADFPADQSPSK